MSLRIEPDYAQMLLLPPCVEDWVSEDHFARFVREFVEEYASGGGRFAECESKEGRPHYSAKTLSAVWLYCFAKKIHSARQIEAECRSDLGLIWLTGNRAPDHTTLCRFFKQNREALDGLFACSVRSAVNLGIASLDLVAVDGTKIAGSASYKGAFVARDLKKFLAALDEEIAAYGELAEGSEGDAPQILPDGLCEREALREAIREQIEALNAENAAAISPVDPEARGVLTSEGVKLGYNLQAAVDPSGVVVGCLASNHANDSALLNPVLDEAERTAGVPVEMAVADGGYFSGENLAGAIDLARPATVAAPSKKIAPDFAFHSRYFERGEGDCMKCPIGGTLAGRFDRLKDGIPIRVFKCQDHSFCPYAATCRGRSKVRTLDVSHHWDAIAAQYAHLQTESASELVRVRKQIVEPYFGWVKRTLRVRRLDHRGLAAVDAYWRFLGLVRNLGILYRNRPQAEPG